MAFFTPPRPSSSRQRSASHSTNDGSTPDRLPQHCARDLSISSQSLESTSSQQDDLPTPSAPTHASHSTSAQSTPMTSPSTGYSSPFHGSLSSKTSDSVESKYRSDFGLLAQGSPSTHPTQHDSSRSSQPVSPRSPYMVDSALQSSLPRIPQKYPSPSHYVSRRPSTAPHTPSVLATATNAGNSPAEHHTRSYSRLTTSIKNLLSKSAIPSPSRFSFNSVKSTPSYSEASSPSFHAVGKSSRKSRPPDLEISDLLASSLSGPSHTSTTPIDVHRRYASELATKFYDARVGGGLPVSQDHLDVSASATPVRVAKTRNVLKRQPSSSAKSIKGRDRGSPSQPREHEPHGDWTPFPLTVAGAVVEAYKQYVLHDDLLDPPKLSMDDRTSSTASYEGHAEPSPVPYYTVVGSPSHIVVGGPDDRWSKFEADECVLNMSRPSSSHRPSTSSSGVGHSITRKVSMRWRKTHEGDARLEEPPRGHSKGQPSVQELPHSRSAGRSMDGAWAGPAAGRVVSESDKGDGNEGSKLWRLMRRLSTGGLRDKFQPSKVVPPVPAIPRELLQNIYADSAEPRSMPGRRPSSPLYSKALTRTTTAPENLSVARPSVATASSSANSSDIPSPTFFQRVHSPSSSVSSYGEAMPRMPDSIDRHIITPREQLRLGDHHALRGEPGATPVRMPRSPRRATSVPGLRTTGTKCDDIPLPCLDRRTSSGESPLSSRPSSASGGSTAASSQSQGTGLGRLQMDDGTVLLSPPPRPPRSAKRGGGPTGSSVQSAVVKRADVHTGPGDLLIRQIDRMPSGRSDMTARPDSSESRRRGQDRSDGPARVQLTFRELDAPRRPPLSEREKADIWNDLLARSDKAGGTLHIHGATELMSDSLRFSTHSEASS